MKKSKPDKNSPYDAGISIIMSAVRLDEALAVMLKLEAQALKKSINNKSSADDFADLHKILRNIISTLILTSDKIQTGIDLINIINNHGNDNEEN